MSGKKLLIGCALGCGGLVLLVIALVASFAVWVGRPGELLEPRKLLGDDTTGYVEWTLRLEDPGTEGFVRALLAAAQAARAEAQERTPRWFPAPLFLGRDGESAEELRRLFPLVAAWTVRPGQTAEADLHLLSLSIQHLGNRLVFLDWMLGWIFGRAEDAEVQRHRGEKIYRLTGKRGGQATFFIRGADVFITSDVETARIAIDRLASSTVQARAPTAVDRLFAETAGGGPLRGAITNDRGELARLWRRFAPDSVASFADDAPWAGIRAATLAGNLNEDGSLTATVSLAGVDAGWAEAHAPALIEALRQALAGTALAPEVQGAAAGDRIRIELRVPDLIGTAGRWIEFQRDVPPSVRQPSRRAVP